MMSIHRLQTIDLSSEPLKLAAPQQPYPHFGAQTKVSINPAQPESQQTPKASHSAHQSKSSFVSRMFKTISSFLFGVSLFVGCFGNDNPRPASTSATVQDLQRSTPKGLQEDEFSFTPLNPPFHMDLPGTHGLGSKDVIMIINTNRGKNNRLGLYQPKGLTQAHLERALQQTTHPEVKNSLNKFLKHFILIDADQNGVITLSDIQQYIDKSYAWYHRPIFSKAEAQQQAAFYVTQQFGIQE